MKYRPWNNNDRDKLSDLLELDLSIEEIATKLDRTERSVEYEISRKDKIDITTITENAKNIKDVKEQLQTAAVKFLDQKTASATYEDIWDTIIRFQTELEKVNTEQAEATISIDTNKWIGIAFQGDLHLGNMATDYSKLLRDKELIQESNNLFVVINGDYCDNYISGSHAGGQFEALFPPAVQKDLAKDYIESIKDKVLALVAGCHDLWSLKIDDFDLTEYLAKHGQAVYLGSGGDLYLQLPGHTYKIKMRHKYRFNSQDNPCHTVKKMFEKEGGFDVGCISHNHIAAMEEGMKEGLDGKLKRIFLRAGSYKASDRYSSQMGFSGGISGVPIVLFNPHERDLRGFEDLEEGINYLNYLNNKNE